MTKLEELKKAHDTACSDYDYADAKMVLAEDAYTAAFDGAGFALVMALLLFWGIK